MKKIVTLLFISLFFSCENVDEVAQRIYDNNVDQPESYGIFPPVNLHGTWLAEDENATIKGFTFEPKDVLIIYASHTESFTTMIANNPGLRIEDFYQTSSSNYFKIYQKMQESDKLWYDFYLRNENELVLVLAQSSVKYIKK